MDNSGRVDVCDGHVNDDIGCSLRVGYGALGERLHIS